MIRFCKLRSTTIGATLYIDAFEVIAVEERRHSVAPFQEDKIETFIYTKDRYFTVADRAVAVLEKVLEIMEAPQVDQIIDKGKETESFTPVELIAHEITPEVMAGLGGILRTP